MPAISSGIFGFPKPLCARVFFETLEKFVLRQDMKTSQSLKEVRLCNFDDETCDIFKHYFDKKFLPLFEDKVPDIVKSTSHNQP